MFRQEKSEPYNYPFTLHYICCSDKRRQSLSSAWGRDNSGAGTGLLGSPKKRHKPPQSLSIDNVTSDCRSQAIPSPGLLSTHSMWNTSDLMLTPSHHADPDNVSK